jgi:hypothetical protein
LSGLTSKHYNLTQWNILPKLDIYFLQLWETVKNLFLMVVGLKINIYVQQMIIRLKNLAIYFSLVQLRY